MNIPKNRKFKKDRKGNQGKILGFATRGNKISNGDFGLKALESFKLTPNQIESMRRVIVRELNRKGKLFINVFCDKPVSKKPLAVRMGSGKGAVDHWVCIIKPGRVLFEIAGVNEEDARRALTLCSYKLPIDTKFLRREDTI